MDLLVKNLHVFIVIYALFGLYTMYEEKSVELETLQVEKPALEQQIVISEKKIKEIESFKEDLEKSKDRVRAVVTQIEKVQKQLPTDVNDTLVQQFCTDTANKLHMINPSPTTLMEEVKGFYFAKNYKLNVSGTFLQTLILLEQISKSERILNVKSLNLSWSKVEHRSRFQILDAEIVLESYRYNTNHKESGGVEEIEEQFKIN